MAEIRETHVKRDEHGRVTDTKVIIDHPKKKKGGFGWGMLLGIVLIAGAMLAFVYSQGSFQQAGAEADRATAQVEQQTGAVVDTAQNAVDNAADETSETATN